MGIDFSAILNFLTNSPGDLIYHLVVILALILTGGLAKAKIVRSGANPRAQHILIGCSILLIIQVLLFGLRFAENTIFLDNPLSITVFQFMAGAVTVSWLVWTFLEQDQRFIITGINLFITLLLILLGTVSLIVINFLQEVLPGVIRFLPLFWQMVPLILILVGLVLILTRKPAQGFVAGMMLTLFAVGYLYEIILPETGSGGMGAVRLAQTLSFPWIIILLQRLRTNNKINNVIKQLKPTEIEENLVDTKPAMVNLLMKIALQETDEDKYKAVVRALSLSAVADICYIVQVPPTKEAFQIIAGYDLIREAFLPKTTLARKDLVHIMDAWEQSQIFTRTPGQIDGREAFTLSELLNYHRLGNVLAYPLSLPEQPLVGGVIFLSPYTTKAWGIDILSLMDEIKTTLAEVLFTSNTQARLKADLDEALNEINNLLVKRDALTQALALKEAEIKEHVTTIKQWKAKFQIERLESVKQIEGLKSKISELASRTPPDSNIVSELEQKKAEIRHLIIEKNRFKEALAQANTRIMELESRTTTSGQTGPIRLSMQNQILSLDSIIANVRLQVAAQLQSRKIDLEIVNPDGRQMIKTDPELLQTALQGLLENAILASQPGSKIQWSQKLSLETGMLIVQVTDYGEGMTKAEQTAFFNTGHETIPGIGSVGSIRNAIRAIRVLNGKIWLRSQKDEFTTFRVQMPVRIID